MLDELRQLVRSLHSPSTVASSRLDSSKLAIADRSCHHGSGHQYVPFFRKTLHVTLLIAF